MVQDYDQSINNDQSIIRIYDSLNIQKNAFMTKMEGKFNEVSSVNCGKASSEGSRTKIAILRKSITPMSRELTMAMFPYYHNEMKEQIGLAQAGLSPNVFMYGVLASNTNKKQRTQPVNVTENPQSTKFALNMYPPPPTAAAASSEPPLAPDVVTNAVNAESRKRHRPEKDTDIELDEPVVYLSDADATDTFSVFCIMEIKSDFFNAFAKEVDLVWKWDPDSPRVIASNKKITSLLNGVMDLIKELGNRRKIFFDIKLDNLVFDSDNFGFCKKVYLIDCDVLYLFPEKAVQAAILTEIPNAEDLIGKDYVERFCERILRYIFCAKTLNTLRESFFDNPRAHDIICQQSWYKNILQPHGELRQIRGGYTFAPPVQTLPKEQFNDILRLRDPQRTLDAIALKRSLPQPSQQATEEDDAPLWLIGSEISVLEGIEKDNAAREAAFAAEGDEDAEAEEAAENEKKMYWPHVEHMLFVNVLKAMVSQQHVYDNIENGLLMQIRFLNVIFINASWSQKDAIKYCFMDLPLDDFFYNLRDLYIYTPK